jgi:DNA-binding transcriptional ArsR family regulator
MAYRNIPEKPDKLFGALAHPIRVKIIECLVKCGPTTPKALSKKISERMPRKISLQLLLQHIKILEKNNIIIRTKQGRLHWCELRSRSVEQMIEWLALQNYLWQDSIDRFEAQ